MDDASWIRPGRGYDGWTREGWLIAAHPAGRSVPSPAIDPQPGAVTFELLTQMRAYLDGRVPS